MASAGVDPVHQDTIIGHSVQGMGAHYIVPDDETLKNAMGKFTKMFLTLSSIMSS